MVGRPTSDKGSEDERDRLQRFLRAVLRLHLLLLLSSEPGQRLNAVLLTIITK